VPQPYSGRVTCFQAAGTVHGDPRIFWSKVARGGVDVHLIPGGGNDIFREPNVVFLAEHLRSCIEKAQAASLELAVPPFYTRR
jgi:hypothetical protein